MFSSTITDSMQDMLDNIGNNDFTIVVVVLVVVVVEVVLVVVV